MDDNDKLARHVFIQWLANKGLLVEWMDRTLAWNASRDFVIDELQDKMPSYLIDTFPWSESKYTNWRYISEQWEEQCDIILTRLEDGYYE